MTHVHVCAISGGSHKDPVRFTGLYFVREKVGSVVILSKGRSSLGVTVAPENENIVHQRIKEHWGTAKTLVVSVARWSIQWFESTLR